MASDEQSDSSNSGDLVNDRASAPASGNDSISRVLGRLQESRFNCSTTDAQWPVIVVNPFRYRRRQRPPASEVDDEALWPIPPPEDLSHHFTDADLERQIEKKFLSFVANSCDEQSNWRRLCRKVKLDQSSLWRLDQEYSNHVREYIYQLLLMWKRRHPEARVRDLVKILSESLMADAAVELKKYLASIHWND
ncbi:uncharacterized protein LOC143301942 [Babylonia areolata]|uniref:uncharacterized protein LOC143301942 n=1 Tax=Babylonia areolata TaxID=304850 RepID=UPI003FD3F37B